MIKFPNKKYGLIYADPPWSYNDKAGAERYYKTMAIDEICNLPIRSITADDCVLFLWGTWPKIYESLKVVESWGFVFKTCAFIWIKTNKRTNPKQYSFLPQDNFDSFWGMGRWTRSNSEFCLLATKGKPERKDAGVHQVIYAPIRKHSKKPEETKNKIIKLCGDIQRIELFARESSQGWDCWGNEVKNNC